MSELQNHSIVSQDKLYANMKYLNYW